MADNIPGYVFSDDKQQPNNRVYADTLHKLVSKATINNLGNAVVGPAHLAATLAGDGLKGGNGAPLSVQTDQHTIEVSNDALRIKDGGVSIDKLDDDLSLLVNQIQTGIFNTFYRVGDLFISLSEENPAERFGGTWKKIQGRCLIGSDDDHAAGTETSLDAEGGRTVILAYRSGTQWFRIFSDGWCEQGGYIASTHGTVDLLREMADADYDVQLTIAQSTGKRAVLASMNRTVKDFYVNAIDTDGDGRGHAYTWTAVGMCALSDDEKNSSAVSLPLVYAHIWQKISDQTQD